MWLAGSLNVYFLEFYKLAESVRPLHKCFICDSKCYKKYRNTYYCRTTVEILSDRIPELVLYEVHAIFHPGLISVGLNYNHSLSRIGNYIIYVYIS